MTVQHFGGKDGISRVAFYDQAVGDQGGESFVHTAKNFLSERMENGF